MTTLTNPNITTDTSTDAFKLQRVLREHVQAIAELQQLVVDLARRLEAAEVKLQRR